MLIELEKVCKIYNQGLANEVKALDDVSLKVKSGSITCLKGASGSGKSTLLAIIGCIFPPTSGRASIAGKQLTRLPDRFRTIHRRQTIGFIFQRFNILPRLNVIDNICLPLSPLGIKPQEQKKRARSLMQTLAIDHRETFPANQISGGELQRVAIARALINDPPLILADEPTAHLDTSLSGEFMDIMVNLQANGKTIIITSHDPLVANHPAIDQTIAIRDGRIDAD